MNEEVQNIGPVVDICWLESRLVWGYGGTFVLLIVLSSSWPRGEVVPDSQVVCFARKSGWWNISCPMQKRASQTYLGVQQAGNKHCQCWSEHFIVWDHKAVYLWSTVHSSTIMECKTAFSKESDVMLDFSVARYSLFFISTLNLPLETSSFWKSSLVTETRKTGLQHFQKFRIISYPLKLSVRYADESCSMRIQMKRCIV